MHTIIRYFDNKNPYSSLMRYENGIIPQIGSVIFITGHTYRVIDMSYDFDPITENEALVDIFVKKFRWANAKRVYI